MGLIAQCDDQFGRLLDHLEATGRLEDTMIV
jgi:arylsulfatase A-like enzyme